MQSSLKVAIAIALLIYLFFILKSVKQKNMRINYLIFWSILGIGFIIALFVPNLVENMSSIMGFELPINMIFSIAIFVTLYFIFNLTSLLTKEQNKNIMLIQEISILKKRVDEIEKQKDGDTN